MDRKSKGYLMSIWTNVKSAKDAESSDGIAKTTNIVNKRKGEWQNTQWLKVCINMDYADAVNHVIQTTEQVKRHTFYEDGRLKDKNAQKGNQMYQMV